MKLYKRILQKAIKAALPHYIHHRNYIGRGNGEVTTIRQIVQVILFAKMAFSKLPIATMILLGFLLLFLFWLIGWVWDKNNGNELEADWGNKRNPAIRKLLKRK